MTRTVLRWQNGSIDFDAVEIEACDNDADITRYPVERGAQLTDHVRALPVTVRLTVIISNDPSREGLSHLDGASPSRGADINVRKTIAPQLAGSIGVVGTSVQLARDSVVRADVRVWGADGSKVQRVQNVYAELVRARNEARLFTIASDDGDYDGMLLKSIRKQRTAQNARAPRYELEFQELMLAILEQREITANPQPRKARSKKPQDAGKKQAVAAPKSAADEASLLHRSTHGDVAGAPTSYGVLLP